MTMIYIDLKVGRNIHNQKMVITLSETQPAERLGNWGTEWAGTAWLPNRANDLAARMLPGSCAIQSIPTAMDQPCQLRSYKAVGSLAGGLLGR